LVGKNKKLIFGRDTVGRSPLHLAGKAGHVELIKFFLNEDAETTKLFDNVNTLGSRYRYSTDDSKTPLGDSLSVQNLSVCVLITSPRPPLYEGTYRYLSLSVLKAPCTDNEAPCSDNQARIKGLVGPRHFVTFA